MDVHSLWHLIRSTYDQAYGTVSENYLIVWTVFIALVVLYYFNIPGRLRGRSSAPQHTFGADREEELKKNQEEVRKKQYEHFSAKLKEDAEKRAEDQQRAAEERAQRFNATGDTTDGKPRTLPSKSYGGGGFSHMNSASKSSRSAVRKVQPRQS